MSLETFKGDKTSSAEFADVKKTLSDLTDALEKNMHDEYEYRAVKRNVEDRSLVEIALHPRPPVSLHDIASERALLFLGDFVALREQDESVQDAVRRLQENGPLKKKTKQEVDLSEIAYANVDALISSVEKGRENDLHELLNGIELQDEKQRGAFNEELRSFIAMTVFAKIHGLPKQTTVPVLGLIFDKRFKENVKQKEEISKLFVQVMSPGLQELFETYAQRNDAKSYLELLETFGGSFPDLAVGSVPKDFADQVRFKTVGFITKLWADKKAEESRNMHALARSFGILGDEDVKKIQRLFDFIEPEKE